MRKINLKLWREHHDRLRAAIAKATGWNREELARDLTKLYSVRAHYRGRVHRVHAALTAGDAAKTLDPTRWAAAEWPYDAFCAAGGKLHLDLTAEDQERYVGRWLGSYERKEEAEAA